MTTLARLEGTLPDGARDELLQAARIVAAYDDRASTACPTCAGAGVTEVPSVLASDRHVGRGDGARFPARHRAAAAHRHPEGPQEGRP